MFTSYSTVTQMSDEDAEDFVTEPFNLFVSRRTVWCELNKEIEYFWKLTFSSADGNWNYIEFLY